MKLLQKFKNMHLLSRIWVIVIFIWLGYGNRSSAQEVIGEMEATVMLSGPLTIVETAEMHLGSWQILNPGFSVYINPMNGNISNVGGLQWIGEMPRRAAFNVSGTFGANFNIFISSKTTLYRNGGGPDEFELIPQVYSVNSGSSTYGVLLGGNDQIYVGGTVTPKTSAINTDGIYTGSFFITIAYQ